jgi:hypothetical protein
VTADLEPPSAPPPPPPPLNIPPSRARRQLAARLALHSKQNAEAALTNDSNDLSQFNEPSNDALNPFVADEDDDSDGEEGDFTIGDLEAEEEGRGHLPPGTGLVGAGESLDNVQGLDVGEVGLVSSASDSASAIAWFTSASRKRAREQSGFPSQWPYGHTSPTSSDEEREAAKERVREGRYKSSRNRVERKTQADAFAQGDGSDDSDDGFPGEGKGSRRLSVTTEAKRRTSLEDDDEEDGLDGVVHVGMAEGEGPEGKVVEGGEGGEDGLVEIRHEEVKGVEAK